MSIDDQAAEDTLARRAGLTLVAVKAALVQWQGHMRRAALLQSEDDYAVALSLVPKLPNPPAYLARTLRGLADLCVSQGRLDEAAGLFERVAGGGGKRSEVFWRDYATLLFRLALKRLGEGHVAAANGALEQAGQLLRGPADIPEAWAAAWDGYGEMALWFERADEAVPAGLYAEKALFYAGKLGAWTQVGHWLRKLAQSGIQKGGATRGLVWLQRLQALRGQGWPEALNVAVQAAVTLAQSELALGRAAGAQEIFVQAEAWLQSAGGESPALADLQLGWGLALGPEQGRAHLEQALSLRRRLLGPQHPRTREAEQALAGLSAASPGGGGDGPREWDGGAQFAAPAGADSAAAEIKRLHRRLARLCHPDTATSAEDALWRHDIMARVNHSADVGDIFSLRAFLREAYGHLAKGQ